MIKIIPPLKFFRLRSRAERRRICLKYGISAAFLLTAFTAGFIRVYVNTYNIMYEDKMVVFDFDRTEDGARVTILGHVFELF